MKLDINDIYDRIGSMIKARTHKDGKHAGEYLKVDIAKALHVDPQDISNWAFRNKFPWEELFNFIQEHNDVSFDWLLTGGEAVANSCPVQCPQEILGLCEKVKEVIAAKDLSYSKSLRANIESFHEAVVEKRAAAIERRKADVGRRSSDIKIAELINAVSALSDKLKYLEKTAVLKPNTDTD